MENVDWNNVTMSFTPTQADLGGTDRERGIDIPGVG